MEMLSSEEEEEEEEEEAYTRACREIVYLLFELLTETNYSYSLCRLVWPLVSQVWLAVERGGVAGDYIGEGIRWLEVEHG